MRNHRNPGDPFESIRVAIVDGIFGTRARVFALVVVLSGAILVGMACAYFLPRIWKSLGMWDPPDKNAESAH